MAGQITGDTVNPLRTSTQTSRCRQRSERKAAGPLPMANLDLDQPQDQFRIALAAPENSAKALKIARLEPYEPLALWDPSLRSQKTRTSLAPPKPHWE
jgi:hypothetical protein